MKKLILIATIPFLFTACSSMKYSQSLDLNAPKFGSDSVDMPNWYMTNDNEPNAIYGVATEASTDIQFAVDKAMLSAKRELASNFSSNIDAMMRDYSAQSGGTDSEILQDINRTTKLVVNRVNLIGVKRTHFALVRDKNQYRAYVKLRYAVDDSNKILMEEIKKNRRLNHKFESSKAFKELEREVTGAPEEKVVSSNTGDSIKLLPVDNEEYKKRRDEALQKEGAVIGQITVR